MITDLPESTTNLVEAINKVYTIAKDHTDINFIGDPTNIFSDTNTLIKALGITAYDGTTIDGLKTANKDNVINSLNGL